MWNVIWDPLAWIINGVTFTLHLLITNAWILIPLVAVGYLVRSDWKEVDSQVVDDRRKVL